MDNEEPALREVLEKSWKYGRCSSSWIVYWISPINPFGDDYFRNPPKLGPFALGSAVSEDCGHTASAHLGQMSERTENKTLESDLCKLKQTQPSSSVKSSKHPIALTLNGPKPVKPEALNVTKPKKLLT